MIRVALAVALTTLTVGSAASAQRVVTAPDENGAAAPRYRFSHTPNGVMRLDSQTGEVMLCKPRDGTFVCAAAPEESERLRAELKQKSDELDTLKSEIARMQAQLSAQTPETAGVDASVKDDIAALKAALEQKTGEIGKLADEVVQLKSQRAGAEPAAPAVDIAPLKGEVATLRIEIGNLKEKLAALGKDTIGQDERHDIVSRIAMLEQNTGGMTGALTRLERQGAELRARIEAQGRRAQQQTAAVPPPADLKPDVSRLDQENTALKGQVAAMSADLATLKDDIAMLRKVAATGDQLAGQRSQIDRLSAENAGLKDQIAALKSETNALQQKLAALAPPPAPRPPAAVPPANAPAPKDQQPNVPSAQDMERARAALADAWRRMVEMIESWRRDILRKDDSVRL